MNKYLDKITGPVIPIPTPFNQDESVDFGALSSYIQFLVEKGIKNVMTTVGTSRYNLLTNEEIMKVNQTMVKAANKKAFTIVANPPVGSLRQAIEFAKHSDEIGADIYLAYYPERFYGDEYLIEFFQSLSDAGNAGILIHEMPMRNGLGGGAIPYSIPLLDKLLNIDNVIGMKEEALDIGYSYKLVKSLSHKAVIIGAGGGMSRYLRDYWLGAKAFLGGIGNFYPQIELDFFNYMMAGNIDKAHQLVMNLETPYFEKMVAIGWHPSLKAALSSKGLMKPFERKPMKQTTVKEMELIKSILKENNW